jgi:hypothetical protein
MRYSDLMPRIKLWEDQQFLAWFRGSRVVQGRQREPMLCYHGTHHGDHTLHPMMHFGTSDAAHERLRGHNAMATARGAVDVADEYNPGANIIAAYLCVRKPLRLDDDPMVLTVIPSFKRIVMKRTALVDQEHLAILHAAKCDDAAIIQAAEQSDINAAAAALLQAKGYDGVVYPNRIEGRRAPSWIIVNPNQVWMLTKPK